MAEKVRRLCCWCKRDMDTGEQLTNEEYIVASHTASHGMCKICRDNDGAIDMQHKSASGNIET